MGQDVCCPGVMGMLVLLAGMLVWLLVRSAVAAQAARDACQLFAQCVLPTLLPYMVLSQLLASRIPGPMPGWLVVLLGWCGGSPTGARLLMQQNRRDKRLAVSCATMSPMFLVGTLGSWLNSTAAGVCILVAVTVGGWLTGRLVEGSGEPQTADAAPLTLGQGIASAAQSMLVICGSMVVFRVVLVLAAELLPVLELPLAVALEATTATQLLSQMPLPLPLRTGLMAGTAGFGGGALLLQNRACYPPGTLRLPEQVLWQAVHGAISFVLALGLMLL